MGRGGSATANMKRFDIGTVFHKSVAGGHPKEAVEATFDIVQDEANIRGHQLEAETLVTVCQVMSSFSCSSDGTFFCYAFLDPLSQSSDTFLSRL